MKHGLYLVCLLACLLAGCAPSRSVLCVAPQGKFTPRSEAELLSELNSQLPFTIPQRYFISKQKSNGLVGWAVVRNDEQKELVKAKLQNSTTLKLLQVEALTPEFEAIMKRQKR